jgi:hypothetical protein
MFTEDPVSGEMFRYMKGVILNDEVTGATEDESLADELGDYCLTKQMESTKHDKVDTIFFDFFPRF